ncbi:MAG: hypothetical protein IT168_10470 [Bryobacterales bacterium]|nr:hypothetical protein [Bryobacterales bacterium]
MRTISLLLLIANLAVAAKFYPDDPLEREPAPIHVKDALRRKVSDYYDFIINTFSNPGDGQPKKGSPIIARGINTLGEPMDGDWYTHRHYFKPMSIDELVRGPGNSNAPSMDGKWKVVKAKTEGITPGFEFIDAKGRRYMLKFDPVTNPEIATAPDALVARFFYALGYHVPENYVVYFTRDQLEVGEDVQINNLRGRPRKMTSRDITELLVHVPHDAEGRYRGGASLFLPGKPLGPFRYYGTRTDDPNDTIPHEHRRELRGLSVFCAWLGHDDSRAINTLDILANVDAIPRVRHYLIDFGSTLGSASSGPNSPRSGFEYLFEWKPAIKQFATLGLYRPSWSTAEYPPLPSVGRFESKLFDPVEWVPEYPNPAFTNRLRDDEFWAAKQVMAFTDAQIRAIVRTGQYSDKRAENYIADTLIARRDKVGRGFFQRTVPLDRFAIRGERLVFDDLAAVHKLSPARNFQYSWFTFDNSTESRAPLPQTGPEIPSVRHAEYLVCDVKPHNDSRQVSVFLRRSGSGWKLVGIDRPIS